MVFPVYALGKQKGMPHTGSIPLEFSVFRSDEPIKSAYLEIVTATEGRPENERARSRTTANHDSTSGACRSPEKGTLPNSFTPCQQSS
jgi:hypothetical protein